MLFPHLGCKHIELPAEIEAGDFPISSQQLPVYPSPLFHALGMVTFDACFKPFAAPHPNKETSVRGAPAHANGCSYCCERLLRCTAAVIVCELLFSLLLRSLRPAVRLQISFLKVEVIILSEAKRRGWPRRNGMRRRLLAFPRNLSVRRRLAKSSR